MNYLITVINITIRYLSPDGCHSLLPMTSENKHNKSKAAYFAHSETYSYKSIIPKFNCAFLSIVDNPKSSQIAILTKESLFVLLQGNSFWIKCFKMTEYWQLSNNINTNLNGEFHDVGKLLVVLKYKIILEASPEYLIAYN